MLIYNVAINTEKKGIGENWFLTIWSFILHVVLIYSTHDWVQYCLMPPLPAYDVSDNLFLK